MPTHRRVLTKWAYSCLAFATWNLPALVLQPLTPAAVTCESVLTATTARPTRNHQCLFNLIYQHKIQVISSCHSCCVTLWLPQAVLKQLKAPQWRSADPRLLLASGPAMQIPKVNISLQATLLPPDPKSPLQLLPNTWRSSGSQRCHPESLWKKATEQPQRPIRFWSKVSTRGAGPHRIHTT